MSGLVTGKRRTKGWKTLEYKLVKWILGQTVEKSASEHYAEYQRNVQTLQKIQHGFKHYLDDVYRPKDSDKTSDRGSSSSPDPSQESPRNPKPQPQTPVATKTNPTPMQTSEPMCGSNTNILVQQHMGPNFMFAPSEYFTDYSAQPQVMSDVNVNVPHNSQQVPYRPDEQMFDRTNYDDEQQRQQQLGAHLPQGVPVSMPLEYLHERYEMQRFAAYNPQEYPNPADPHAHAYGTAPHMYRPVLHHPVPPYFVPPQGSGMAPNMINLQPMQQQPNVVHMNMPMNYSNAPGSNVNYSANQPNENVPQDYED